MKFLIFVSCILAASSAAYHGPIHIPVIGPNGVPIEPHEVQAARASHLVAVASSGGHAFAAPYSVWGGVPSVSHNALPLDTPEVAAAKVQHYRDFAVAAGRNGVHVPLAAPLVHYGGAYPVDTPEVQQAKAAHFAAHAAARSGSYVHYRKRRAIYGGYHIPVIGPNGVPVDTPEVQAAKASHFQALAQASARAGPADYTASDDSWAPSHNRYYGPLATIGPDGRPQETPEVRAATAYHLSAHAAARSGYFGHY